MQQVQVAKIIPYQLQIRLIQNIIVIKQLITTITYHPLAAVENLAKIV
jgi:hypothetical protein